MLIVLRTICGIMRRKEGLIMIQRKKALCAASASALAALGGLYGLYRYAFYSPRGAQNDDHHISTNPQMQVYREEISRAIDALNALPCERVYITSADGLRLTGRYYPAKPGAPIDFFLRNIERKYGSVDAWKAAQPERLAGWGFNTLGNWSDSLLCRNGKMPYLIDIPLPASTRLPGNPSLWDVYDPEFARRLEHYLANTIGWTRNDPFCIGYFIGNEVKFGPEDEAARRIFTAPAERPAKRELVRFLKGKFSSIDKLNRAWGSRYASWEELAASTRPPERKLAQKEFAAFSRGYIERFYRISRDTVRKCAPNHLYLGSRTPVADIYRAHVNEPHAAYADVVSVNNYALQLDNLKMRGIPDDKPLLISESSVGHQSRGVFSSLSYPGLEPGAREDALNCLLKSAARHPQIVGIHHFQFADQPLIGRYDGENYGIGLVDVTDTPYREFVGANRNFSEQLYRFRRGTPPVKFRRGF